MVSMVNEIPAWNLIDRVGGERTFARHRIASLSSSCIKAEREDVCRRRARQEWRGRWKEPRGRRALMVSVAIRRRP